jgi:hypothetical protein
MPRRRSGAYRHDTGHLAPWYIGESLAPRLQACAALASGVP